jgi:phosphate uptake regulator
MVNVARTTWRLHPGRLDTVAGPLVDRMSRQVIVQLRVAVNAFVDRDPSWAAALADMDDTTDPSESGGPSAGRRWGISRSISC